MAEHKEIFSSTFIFAKGEYDDAFHKLDEEIAQMAKAISGYLGEETWENAATGQISNVYYWESLESLQQLVSHPRHQEAKSRQTEWLAGYQVVISKVLRTYGDGKLSSMARGLPATYTPNQSFQRTAFGGR